MAVVHALQKLPNKASRLRASPAQRNCKNLLHSLSPFFNFLAQPANPSLLLSPTSPPTPSLLMSQALAHGLHPVPPLCAHPCSPRLIPSYPSWATSSCSLSLLPAPASAPPRAPTPPILPSPGLLGHPHGPPRSPPPRTCSTASYLPLNDGWAPPISLSSTSNSSLSAFHASRIDHGSRAPALPPSLQPDLSKSPIIEPRNLCTISPPFLLFLPPIAPANPAIIIDCPSYAVKPFQADLCPYKATTELLSMPLRLSSPPLLRPH